MYMLPINSSLRLQNEFTPFHFFTVSANCPVLFNLHFHTIYFFSFMIYLLTSEQLHFLYTIVSDGSFLIHLSFSLSLSSFLFLILFSFSLELIKNSKNIWVNSSTLYFSDKGILICNDAGNSMNFINNLLRSSNNI